jgi:hypothetical protein
MNPSIDMVVPKITLDILILLFLFATRYIMCNGGADELFQSGLIDVIAFMQIDGARGFGIQTSVEYSFWILQGSAFEEAQLDMIFERADGDHVPFLGPYRSVPLLFLSKVGGGLTHQVA